VLHGSCIAGQPNGTRTEYEEGNDIDQTMLNGGGPYSPYDGGVKSIDPNKLMRDPFNGCAPVYPWNFIRANTIFGVIHKAGGLYGVVRQACGLYGRLGTHRHFGSSNLDDYYSPRSTPTRSRCPASRQRPASIAVPFRTTTGRLDHRFRHIKCYDQLKVNAVLNWIQGKTHLGGGKGRVLKSSV